MRRAILNESGITGDDVHELVRAKFDVPLGVWPIERYFEGTLRVDDAALLTTDAPLIRAAIRSSFKRARRTAEGELAADFETAMDGSVTPPGASIEIGSQYTRMPVGIPEGGKQPRISISDPKRSPRPADAG